MLNSLDYKQYASLYCSCWVWFFGVIAPWWSQRAGQRTPADNQAEKRGCTRPRFWEGILLLHNYTLVWPFSLFSGPWILYHLHLIFPCHLIIIVCMNWSDCPMEKGKNCSECNLGSIAIVILHGTSTGCTTSKILSMLSYHSFFFW